MPQSSKRMNFQQFQTCLREYFPGISISQIAMRAHLKPHSVLTFNHTQFNALDDLWNEFHLHYRYYFRSLYLLDELVIGFDDDHADYRYGSSRDSRPIYSEETLLRLLKMASDSVIFHYNKV